MALTLNNISFKGQTASTIQTTVTKHSESPSSIEEDQRQFSRLLGLTSEDLRNDPGEYTAYWGNPDRDTLTVHLKDGTEVNTSADWISIDKKVSSHSGDSQLGSTISERFQWRIDNKYMGKETPEFVQEVRQIFVHLAKLAEPFLIK